MTNPLITPDRKLLWMSEAAFNPGVIRGSDGVFRMLIRGSVRKDTSRSSLGLALSSDGFEWNILRKPVLKSGISEWNTRGVEDPRIVEWNGEYYIFATAYSTLGTRIGIWRTKNFLEWHWVGAIDHGVNDKNGCIIPDTLYDPYLNPTIYLLHRHGNDITISENGKPDVEGEWSNTSVLSTPENWYSMNGERPWRIGIGGQPVLIPELGWFVVTHVVHRKPKLLYTLSFMILERFDPKHVIYIHPEPILKPEMEYELEGNVPNVVFSAATVDANQDELYIYWGGADTVICGGLLRKKDIIENVRKKG